MSVLAPAAVVDPSAAPVICEVCGTPTTVGASHSFIIIYATTGGAPGLPAFQCPATQHFCCSQACAARAAHACIDEHLLGEHAARLAATPTGQAAIVAARLEAAHQLDEAYAARASQSTPAPLESEGVPTKGRAKSSKKANKVA